MATLLHRHDGIGRTPGGEAAGDVGAGCDGVEVLA